MMIGTLVCPACGELNPMSRGRLHPLRSPAPPRRRGAGARAAAAPAATATRAGARAALVVVAVDACSPAVVGVIGVVLLILAL